MRKFIILIISILCVFSICYSKEESESIVTIQILCSHFLRHYSIHSANLEIGLINKGINQSMKKYHFQSVDGDSSKFVNSKSFSSFKFYNVIIDTLFFQTIEEKISKVKRKSGLDISQQSRLLCFINYNDDTADYIHFNYDTMIINGNVMEIDKDLLQLFFPYMPESFRETFIMYFELEND